jgi:mRNA-degrading endonuclease RelE of RelBE toxin-antitoxin system
VFREVRKTPEFKRDLKRLSKRFLSLEEDLQILIESSLVLYHHLHLDNRGIEAISGIQRGRPVIYKVIKFACRSLPGRGAKSGLRLIYAYWEEKDRVDLIQLYFKSDQEMEDRERIKKYLDRLRG